MEGRKNAQSHKTVQMRGPFPWTGKILPWSAALRARPERSAGSPTQGVLADVPRHTQVKVLGWENGWLRVEVQVGHRRLQGYISQELVRRISAPSVAEGQGRARTGRFEPVPAPLREAEEALETGRWQEAVRLLERVEDAQLQAWLEVQSAVAQAYLVQGAALARPPSGRRVLELVRKQRPFACIFGLELARTQTQLESLEAALRVEVIPRESWGALPPDKRKGWHEYPSNAPLPLNRIVVHHTADPIGQTLQELEAKVRGDGYADLPYHFIITMDGRIHEGRSIKAVGAHAGEFHANTDIKKDPDYGALGIALTGDFEPREMNAWLLADKPTRKQIESLQRLLNHLAWKYEIPPRNILKHSEVKRDGKPKKCPGVNLAHHVESCVRRTQETLRDLESASRALREVQDKIKRLK